MSDDARCWRMYDSVNVRAIPAGAKAVAGYVDGHWPTYSALLARHYPRAHCLSITVLGGRAACLDFEQGDVYRVSEAVQWVRRELQHGTWRPCVYANRSTWDGPLRAALRPFGSRIRRWVADYDGVAEVPDGFDAKQFTDHGPNGCDVSICLPDFFPARPLKKRPRRPSLPHRPHPKVAAATLAGAAAVILQAVLASRGALHVHLSQVEVAAITAAASSIAAAVKRSG